jgi:hypothetical protein
MVERDGLRAAIVRALGAMRRGDEDDALTVFTNLAASEGSPVRDSVLELGAANVAMLRTLTGYDEADDEPVFAFADETSTEERGLIDEIPPAQRSTARVLLALANGYPADAEIQLDIVEQAPEAGVIGQVFAYMLGWTLELLDLCEATGQQVPRWLRPVFFR